MVPDRDRIDDLHRDAESTAALDEAQAWAEGLRMHEDLAECQRIRSKLRPGQATVDTVDHDENRAKTPRS
jgi:hypothetical protein